MRFGPWILNRQEVLGILFAVVVLGVTIFVLLSYPAFRAATGFGPDWDCTAMPKGDPICVKKPTR